MRLYIIKDKYRHLVTRNVQISTYIVAGRARQDLSPGSGSLARISHNDLSPGSLSQQRQKQKANKNKTCTTTNYGVAWFSQQRQKQKANKNKTCTTTKYSVMKMCGYERIVTNLILYKTTR